MKTTRIFAKGLATLILTASVALFSLAATAGPKVIDLRPLLRQGGGLHKVSSGRMRAVNLRGLDRSHKAPDLRQFRDVGKRLGVLDGNRRGSSHGGGRYGNGSLHPLNGRDIQDAIGYLDRNYGRNYGRDYGRNYGDRRHDRYDDGYYGDSDREYAHAYRDVGIANAVANVVGTIVSSQPGVVRPYGPTYERQRVILKPGYYEEVREWVPDMTDPRTGDRIMGHYETRQRWVPEVYGYQDIRVP